MLILGGQSLRVQLLVAVWCQEFAMSVVRIPRISEPEYSKLRRSPHNRLPLSYQGWLRLTAHAAIVAGWRQERVEFVDLDAREINAYCAMRGNCVATFETLQSCAAVKKLRQQIAATLPDTVSTPPASRPVRKPRNSGAVERMR